LNLGLDRTAIASFRIRALAEQALAAEMAKVVATAV
jgi:hypothetical protein